MFPSFGVCPESWPCVSHGLSPVWAMSHPLHFSFLPPSAYGFCARLTSLTFRPFNTSLLDFLCDFCLLVSARVLVLQGPWSWNTKENSSLSATKNDWSATLSVSSSFTNCTCQGKIVQRYTKRLFYIFETNVLQQALLLVVVVFPLLCLFLFFQAKTKHSCNIQISFGFFITNWTIFLILYGGSRKTKHSCHTSWD